MAPSNFVPTVGEGVETYACKCGIIHVGGCVIIAGVHMQPYGRGERRQGILYRNMIQS